MNHNTPEGLPPLPTPVFVDQASLAAAYTIEQMEAYAREALRSQAASVEPVGSIDHVEWSASKEQWRHNIWADNKIPFGTKLYAGAPPAHVPADVEAAAWDKVGLGANPDYKQPTPEPAQAVDARIGQQSEYWGSLAQQKADADVRRGVTMPVSYYVSTVVGAALAARQPQPQAQQGGGEQA